MRLSRDVRTRSEIMEMSRDGNAAPRGFVSISPRSRLLEADPDPRGRCRAFRRRACFRRARDSGFRGSGQLPSLSYSGGPAGLSASGALLAVGNSSPGEFFGGNNLSNTAMFAFGTLPGERASINSSTGFSTSVSFSYAAAEAAPRLRARFGRHVARLLRPGGEQHRCGERDRRSRRGRRA